MAMVEPLAQRHAQIDQIVFVEAFEVTAVGKTSRKELRARLRENFMAESQETRKTEP